MGGRRLPGGEISSLRLCQVYRSHQVKKRETRLVKLIQAAQDANLWIDTYSPGDGATRYRFFDRPGQDYFSGRAVYTALGYKDAVSFLAGRGIHVG
jgi:hypothetical protein